MPPAFDVSARDHDVRGVLLHDRQHARQQNGWMAEIRIDDADDRCLGRGEALDNSGAQTELAGTMNHADAGALRELVGQPASPIRRVVVDDDQFGVESGAGVRVEQGGDELLQPVTLVVGRDDDGQGWDVLRGVDHAATIL